jgi:hypothetical protein
MVAGDSGFLGNPGPDSISAQPGVPSQVGAEPLGARTGAPPWTRFRSYQIIPSAAVGVGGQQPTMVVEPDVASREIVFIAPFVGFSIFIGDAGVSTNPGSNGLALPPGLPYSLLIPGFQHIYAVTDAPVYLVLRVQTAALLIGDRERK